MFYLLKPEKQFLERSALRQRRCRKNPKCAKQMRKCQLTIDIGAEGRVPVELGSPANKVQKVGMPSTSGEPSQINVVKTIDLTQG